MASIWGSNGGVAATPAAGYRVPVDLSAGGTANHYTTQQLADLATLVGTTHNALGSINSATAIDLSAGPYVSATIAGALTFTFTNPPASPNGCEWTLVLTNGGSAIVTWPGSVTWAGSTAPTLTASGTDVLHFVTGNGGTNWYGWHERDEAASGDVVGPASSTDNAVARFDSTTGKLLQNTSNVTIADTGAVSITPDANAKALTIASHTQTASNPAIDVAQTWNSGATAFTGVKFNVTDTASSASSNLLDVQLGGSSVFRVRKTSVELPTILMLTSNPVVLYSTGGGALWGTANNTGFSLPPAGPLQWSGTSLDPTAAADLILSRDAANRLALRRTTNAQTLIVSGTYSGASDYVQAELGATSTAVTLSAVTAGTGADDVPLTLTAAGVSHVIAASPFRLKSYTVATLPSAATAGALIYVSDETGGEVVAFSDGTNWRRVTDRAVVS